MAGCGARSAGPKILNSRVVEPVGMWGTAQQLSTYPQAARRANAFARLVRRSRLIGLGIVPGTSDRVRWWAAWAR